jgi:hypothetical protein
MLAKVRCKFLYCILEKSKAVSIHAMSTNTAWRYSSIHSKPLQQIQGGVWQCPPTLLARGRVWVELYLYLLSGPAWHITG